MGCGSGAFSRRCCAKLVGFGGAGVMGAVMRSQTGGLSPPVLRWGLVLEG